MNNKRFVIIAVIAAILLVGGAAYYWEVVNPAEECDCAPVEEDASEVIERKINIPVNAEILRFVQDVPLKEYDGALGDVVAKLKKIDDDFREQNYHITIAPECWGGHDGDYEGYGEPVDGRYLPDGVIKFRRVVGNKVFTDKDYDVTLEAGNAVLIEYFEEMPTAVNDNPEFDNKILQAIERFEQTDRYRRIDENLIKGEVIRTARNRYEYSYFGNTLRYVDSVVYKADNGYWKTVAVNEVISLSE